jgi:hypothetical protein
MQTLQGARCVHKVILYSPPENNRSTPFYVAAFASPVSPCYTSRQLAGVALRPQATRGSSIKGKKVPRHTMSVESL